MTRRELRTVPRYFLNPPLHGFAGSLPVRLVDLSVRGSRLELTRPFTPGHDVVLTVLWPAGEMKLSARVLWCDIDTLLVDAHTDRYLAGVAFSHVSGAVGEVIDELCARDLAIRIEDAREHDRYLVTAPLTGSFGGSSVVSIIDISAAGARIGTHANVVAGDEGDLRFQVDDESGPTSVRGKVIWTAPAIEGGRQAGLLVTGQEDALRAAIHRLCLRGEARINLQSLRRKFDQLRTEAARQRLAG